MYGPCHSTVRTDLLIYFYFHWAEDNNFINKLKQFFFEKFNIEMCITYPVLKPLLSSKYAGATFLLVHKVGVSKSDKLS